MQLNQLNHEPMANLADLRTTGTHLREIAARLREAYAVPLAPDPTIEDLMVALDSPELREILLEMQMLREEELARLERLLSRHAANDR